MQMSMKLEGVPALLSQLNKTERGILNKMLRRGLRNAAKPILQTAKRLVRFSGGKKYNLKTGKRVKGAPKWVNRVLGIKHLRSMLGIRAAKRRKGRRNEIGVIVGLSNKGFTGQGFYGAFLELGTGHAPAYPFLRPAFDSNLEQSNAIMRDELDAALIGSLTANIK